MKKTAYKTLCIFLIISFVMSFTGAAATCSSSKPVANADTYSLSPSSKCAGNVLSNDKGTNLKIASTGYIKTVKGVKVYLKSNGYFCYYPASSFKTGTITDSFTYKIVDKYKEYSTAKVTISYKCSSASSTNSVSEPVANADMYSLSPNSKCAGNVLSNDKGSGLKIASTGYIKTAKGVKVYLKSNGNFCYYPSSSFKTGTITDSFTYKIVDKYKEYSTAKVTISYKCSSTSSSSSGTQTKSVVEVTKLSQIDSALKNGPVLLKLGAEWCGPCNEMKSILTSLATEYTGKATVMSIDIDNNPDLTSYFGVDSIPDMCVIVGTQDGKYVYMKTDGKVSTTRSQARFIGVTSKSTLQKVLNLAIKY
jgi:thioredoxin 1